MQTRLQKSLNSCGICYDKVITQGKIESCNHIFCFNCIHQWADVIFFLFFRDKTLVRSVKDDSTLLKKYKNE